MPRLTLSGLLRKLEDSPSHAFIFLHGEEEYLREEALRAVVERVLDPATRDFNLDQLRGAEASPEQLGSLLGTPPMMADHRLIVVRDAQGLSPKARDVVQSGLDRPTPGVVLVLSATIPDRTKAKFYDVLRKRTLALECPAVDVNDLPGWLVERAAALHGVEIEMDAARALSAAIGSQLGALATELEKAVAYVGERRAIGLDDIKAVGGYIPRVDRWAWYDRIGARQFSEALAELPHLLESGESAVGLVIGMTSHLLKLGLIVAGGREALERELRSNQRWLTSRLQPQARKWTLDEIDRSLGELLRADRLLKSASMTDAQAMQELLLRLSFITP